MLSVHAVCPCCPCWPCCGCMAVGVSQRSDGWSYRTHISPSGPPLAGCYQVRVPRQRSCQAHCAFDVNRQHQHQHLDAWSRPAAAMDVMDVIAIPASSSASSPAPAPATPCPVCPVCPARPCGSHVQGPPSFAPLCASCAPTRIAPSPCFSSPVPVPVPVDPHPLRRRCHHHHHHHHHHHQHNPPVCSSPRPPCPSSGTSPSAPP
jgi:hypothetical protein